MCVTKSHQHHAKAETQSKDINSDTVSDGCMGSEKTRTIVLTILMFIFCWFAFGAYINALKAAKGIGTYPAFIMVIVGVCIILVANLLTIPYLCGVPIKKIIGVIYMIGGALYFSGFCFIMDYYRKSSGSATITS